MLGIVEYYTNITFTEKQKEDPAKLYDLLVSNSLLELILNNIPEEEKQQVFEGAESIVKAYYQHINSILGVLETVKTQYQAQ
jgi:hypothetical protein